MPQALPRKLQTQTQEPYGIFIGGPVVGNRVCEYTGEDNQTIILVDHPGDELSIRMTAEELIPQMKRAKSSAYYPNGLKHTLH